MYKYPVITNKFKKTIEYNTNSYNYKTIVLFFYLIDYSV